MTRLTPERREEIREAADQAIIALDELANLISRAGGRDATSDLVRYFAAYHQADLEGKSRGAGWLGGPFLRDALADLRDEIESEDEDDDEPPVLHPALEDDEPWSGGFARNH